MKIPVLDGPSVQTRAMPTPYSNQNFDNGGGDVSRALGQLGQQVSEFDAKLQHRRDEADAMAVTAAVNQYQHASTSITEGNAEDPSAAPGYFTTKGKAAAEQSSNALDALNKARAQIADNLSSEKQRELFARHSADLEEATRARIERHVSQQIEVEREATLKGSMATALTDVANNHSDEQTAAMQTARVEGILRALSLPGEDTKAKVQEWEASVAKVRLQKYLDERDWQGAENLFTRSKEVLGTQSKTYEHAISVLKMKDTSDSFAAKAVAEATEENGRVDPAKAYARLDEIKDPQLRQEAEQRVDKRVTIAQHAWKAKVEGWVNAAVSDYTNGGHDLGAIDARVQGLLTDPRNGTAEEWRKIELMAKADAEHDRSRSKQETPEERDALIEARAKIYEKADEYRAMSPAQFKLEWSGRLSESGYKEVGRLFSDLKKQPKGGEAEFNRFVTDEVRGNSELKNKNTANQFKAYMGDLRRDFLAEKKREPNLKEMEDMKVSAWKTVTKEGLLWNSQVPAFQAPKPTAALAKTPDAPPKPAAPKMSMPDRARQLKAAGKSVKEITATLQAEGY